MCCPVVDTCKLECLPTRDKPNFILNNKCGGINTAIYIIVGAEGPAAILTPVAGERWRWRKKEDETHTTAHSPIRIVGTR